MIRAREVSEFPWAALDRLDSGIERTLRAARRRLELGARPEAFAEAMSGLLDSEISLHVLSVDSRDPLTPLVRVGFRVHGGAGRCVVGVEAALAGALLAKLLRRPLPLLHSDRTLEPVLLGALSALVVETARRTHPARALVPEDARVAVDSAVVHLSVIVDGRPHAAAVWLGLALPAPPEANHGGLGRLWEAEIALPLVVAENLAEVEQLARLDRGAAWCPGSGWLVNTELQGRGILVAGASSRGLSVELGPSARIVLGQAATASLIAPDSMTTPEADSPATDLSEAVLDAPLVVRVEVGSVSMKAREWAALRPGDVIETGRRIAEPVRLRAGGQVLAHGELVTIEGELGVRITEIGPGVEP